ncbi:MAG TPA: hypothetical protein VGB07_36235 [Blastocatellia bacterium]
MGNTSNNQSQTSVIVLIVTPLEADKIYTTLGKMPAEAVEQLRGKVLEQVNGQRELILSFCRQPAVQALIGEIAATPDAIDDGTMDNASETVN